ncbi:T9SS type A sorting domain-containing protein [Nonlabens ponticola]|nr:T9SS type A sorting domain-containing protein [Nonlabens ponticola]
MKKVILAALALSLIAVCAYMIYTPDVELSAMELKREKHREFIANSPFSDSKDLTKAQRKSMSLPPNAYNERMWELTMNPELGYPTPYVVDAQRAVNASIAKSTPGSEASPWIERGPLNVGGRTRVVFYDPNDVGANNGDGTDYNRVFAGGVGGGLWVNDNIESANSRWNQVPGLASSLNISCFAIDPTDSNTIYLGTGEQYTDGASIGNGVYKSTDGGDTWEQVNIQPAFDEDLTNGSDIFKSGVFFVNDLIVREVDGGTEVYAGIGAAFYGAPNFNFQNPRNFLGTQNAGLYRSTDDGDSWSRIEDEDLEYDFNGLTFYTIPNDFELSADNTLYFGSIDATGVNVGGGRIFSSSDGTDWTELFEIGSGDRVEISPSATNPNKFYVLAQVAGQANIYLTENGFATLDQISEPDDADNGIPASDFTRGQSFYDLVIETDPEDDDQLYVGGINIHRSRDAGDSWDQISRWSNNPNMDNLSVPFVHADIHSIAFKPGDSNEGVIGSDGGVSIVESFARATRSSGAIENRNLGYNVTQFYYGDIAATDFEDGDEFVGGTQDNGSQVFNNSNVAGGLSNSFDPIGGDGSFSAVDSESGYVVLGFTSRNHYYFDYPLNPDRAGLFDYINRGEAYTISSESDGDFINVGEVDRAFDIFYSNSRGGSGGGGSTTITACELGANSADCNEINVPAVSGSRPTALTASPFAAVNPVLFIGTEDSRVLRVDNTLDANPVTTDISGDDFLGSASDIRIGETELEIYVTMHNYGINNIWYTNDGGLNWSQKDGDLPDLPVKAILPNPLVENEVIIGTEMGIYVTTDFDSDSPTWTLTVNGMSTVKVLDLDLREADNTILATTHGRGLFTGQFTTAGIGSASAPISQLNVYPTQVTNELNIESSKNFSSATIKIFDLNGHEVMTLNRDLGNANSKINVAGLSSGLYLLQAQSQGLNETIKFVKE